MEETQEAAARLVLVSYQTIVMRARSKFAVRALPRIGSFQEFGVSIISNKFHRLPVFTIFIPAFPI
jgi:hypothetical protein